MIDAPIAEDTNFHKFLQNGIDSLGKKLRELYGDSIENNLKKGTDHE